MEDRNITTAKAQCNKGKFYHVLSQERFLVNIPNISSQEGVALLLTDPAHDNSIDLKIHAFSNPPLYFSFLNLRFRHGSVSKQIMDLFNVTYTIMYTTLVEGQVG